MGDSVSLKCAKHPAGPWYKSLWFWLFPPTISDDSIEDVEIEVKREGSGLTIKR